VVAEIEKQEPAMQSPTLTRRRLAAAALIVAVAGGALTPSVATAEPTRFTGNPLTDIQKTATKKVMTAYAEAVVRAAKAEAAFTGGPVSVNTMRSAVEIMPLPSEFVVKFSKSTMTITSKKHKTVKVTVTVAKDGKITIR
jgi:hypothetical protein